MNVFKKLSTWYFRRNVLPYWVVLLADTVIVFASCCFTFWITNNTDIAFESRAALLYSAFFYSVVSWIGIRIFKTYSGVLRYSSFVDLLKLVYANTVSLAISLGCCWLFSYFHVRALSAFSYLDLVVAFALATFVMWIMRVLVKLVFDGVNESAQAQRALIYGAISGGVAVAKAVRSQTPRRFEVVGFISHEHRIKDMKLLGVKVYSKDADMEAVIKKERIQAMLVSPMRISEFQNNQKLQDICIANGVKIYMSHWATEASIKDGTVQEEGEKDVQLKEVSVEDLLPRQEIRVDMKSVEEVLTGKRVLITGSAGREFPDVEAEVVVTSISRRTRMESVFSTFRPDYVFHAAAYKHVPMMEDNPSEAVLNNIYGTKVIADMSVKYGAKKFVMISTDKAVNPTNVMGCSKRICEIYVQSLDRKLKLEAMESSKGHTGKRPDRTQFVTTRFGNVLGSNGSVIPLFREQIRRGGPVTVTDERIVRFFMLIPEACRLVLEAGTKGAGGEIFVFDMGQPVKIADLAKRMIAMSGAKNVEIKYTGLRDGEKLYEEVLNELEGTKPTFHEKIRIAQVREYDYDQVAREIDELVDISKQFDDMATVRKMKLIVPEYKSNNSIYEKLDAELAGGGITLKTN